MGGGKGGGGEQIIGRNRKQRKGPNGELFVVQKNEGGHCQSDGIIVWHVTAFGNCKLTRQTPELESCFTIHCIRSGIFCVLPSSILAERMKRYSVGQHKQY